MNRSVLLGCLWTLVMLAPTIGAAANPPAANSTPAGNVERGRQLFEANHCPLCHGHQAQGGGAFGPRLGPDGVSYDALRIYIRAPAGDMPPFTAKALPDRDLVDLYAYISSQPAPPPTQSIAILNH